MNFGELKSDKFFIDCQDDKDSGRGVKKSKIRSQ